MYEEDNNNNYNNYSNSNSRTTNMLYLDNVIFENITYPVS
jgi:hypothetical protein